MVMVSGHSISTRDSICILALGLGERLLYPSNRVRTANPVSVRVRVMVSASLSSAAVESPVLIESWVKVSNTTLLRHIFLPYRLCCRQVAAKGAMCSALRLI